MRDVSATHGALLAVVAIPFALAALPLRRLLLLLGLRLLLLLLLLLLRLGLWLLALLAVALLGDRGDAQEEREGQSSEQRFHFKQPLRG